MSSHPDIRALVDDTVFIDTHEHLIEESQRLAGEVDPRVLPCDDFAYLLLHYTASDLIAAGMPGAARQRFFGRSADPDEKWELVEPYWERVKYAGYGSAVRRSVRKLYGVDDLNRSTYAAVNDRYRKLIQPGYYETVLREHAGVESCQVNSLQTVFMETEYPALLFQDLSFVAMSTGLDVEGLSEATGLPANTLAEWHCIIDWHFEEYGPRAIAVKNQSAYSRRLNYEDVSEEEAAPLFERHVRQDDLDAAEMKALQDHLFRYCVGRATEYRLPVKLHTGYYAGANAMPLERLRQNAGDLCPLLHDFPDTTFVLMHLGYPYQDEFIALGKQYSNARIDLCWTWIINPAASVRFLKEFLMAAPTNHVYTFGGDFYPVENIVGHAEIARQGITQALSELVEEGWLSLGEALELAPRLMHENARDDFRIAEKTAVIAGEGLPEAVFEV